MANVSVTNTDADLSGHTLAVCETAKTITAVWTYTGVPVFTNGFTASAAVTFAGVQNVLPNAAVSAPSLVFANSATTGFYSAAAGEVDIALGGVQSFKLEGTNGLTIFGVNLVNASGKILALSSTYFASLSGANLTALNASAITSGTVPTANLGSGSATSSTFLRGDGTWAATSSTAISVYTTTLHNVDNSTTPTAIVDIPVIGGTVAEGDIIRVILWTKNTNTAGGGTVNRTYGFKAGAGTQRNFAANGIADSTTDLLSMSEFVFIRNSNAFWASRINAPDVIQTSSIPTDFASNFTLSIFCTEATADAAIYEHPLQAAAYLVKK